MRALFYATIFHRPFRPCITALSGCGGRRSSHSMRPRMDVFGLTNDCRTQSTCLAKVRQPAPSTNAKLSERGFHRPGETIMGLLICHEALPRR